jgi:hypothetical protein
VYASEGSYYAEVEMTSIIWHLIWSSYSHACFSWFRLL